MKVNKCSKCGGNVCVCSDGRWAAHCQDCSNGFPVDYKHHTKDIAIIVWNDDNPVKDKE